MFRLKVSVFLSFFFILASVCVGASPREFPGHVTSVTVYPSGALINRTRQIDFDATGMKTVVFVDLPGILDPQSVRLKAHGSAVASIVDLDIILLHHTPESSDLRLKEAQSRLQSLRDQSDDIKAALEDLERQRTLLDGLKLIPAGDRTSLPSLGQIKGLIELSYKEREKLRSEIRGLERDLDVLAGKIRSAEKEIDALRNKTKWQTYNAVAHLDVSKAGTLILNLEYTVSGAWWKPEYAVRAEDDSKTISLELRARIRQTTGEDWSDVILSVSTARPSRALILPPVTPWYLQFIEPLRVSPVPAPRPKDKKAWHEKKLKGGVSDQMEARPVESEVHGGTVASFRVPGRTSLPGDGTEKILTLQEHELPAQLGWRAAPMLAQEVFLFAEIENKTGLALLPGKCQMFLDGVYTGQARLSATPSGDTFKLFLGVDRDVEVKRELIEKKEDHGGFISKEKVHHYVYKFTARNHRKRPVKLTLQDRIPVPTHADIKVKWQADPLPGKNEKGVLTWDLAIDPEASKAIELSYVISYPRDKDLVVLP
jgi:uncharacterized protein (TIGR02231 family)